MRTLRAALLATLCIGLVVPLGAQAAKDGPPAVKVPTFIEEASAAGIEHTYAGGFDHYVGGGVAVLDCDDDGRPELYVAGGEAPAALFRNRSRDGNRLRFKPLTSETTDLVSVVGAYPLDIDSDGHTDLAVLRYGENVLLRGVGGCEFERANEAWGFDGGDDWTTAFSATWEAGHDWPTLAFGNYVDHFDEQHLAHCGPGSLLRPRDDDRGFAVPLPLEPGRCALSMLFSDWDRSGRRDLRVANDRHYYYNEGAEQLWTLASGDQPHLYTAEEGWQTVRIFGMGIAGEDLTGDGLPEYYLTSIGSNRLETLEGDATAPTFEDIAFDYGITSTTPVTGRAIDPSTSWHPEFDDVNNDGRLDLYVSKGNVDEADGSARKDPNELYLGQADGTFRRVAKRAGILSPVRTRGAALVDMNRDGLLDIVEVNRYENVSLRRNVGQGTPAKPRPMGHWLGVELEQDGPNVDAIGAWIELDAGDEVIAREVTSGGGHAGGSLGPIHFGLGGRDQAQIRVVWPDGVTGAWQTIPADQVVTLRRSADPTPGQEGS